MGPFSGDYSIYTLFSSMAGVTVGLIQTSYNTPETGGPLGVCVQMFDGNLVRNVSLTVTTSDGTAIGMIFRHSACIALYMYTLIMSST